NMRCFLARMCAENMVKFLAGIDSFPVRALSTAPRKRERTVYLLQVNSLVMTRRVELGTPNFVQGLMLSSAKAHGSSKPHLKIANILKCVHQFLGVELRPVPF